MNFFQRILFYISVPKCVSCGERLSVNDVALCRICRKEYYDTRGRSCSVCSLVLSECTCPNDYLKNHYIKRLAKVFRYVNRDDNRHLPANMLIYSLKQDNREDVLSFLSDELFGVIKDNIVKDCKDYIITSVPRRKGAVRKYGIDHAKLLAKATAKKLGIPYVSLLKSTAKAPQKKMRDAERIKNATFDYKKNIKDVKGMRVIIVDDIVTTGASMGSCAMLIHALGAKEIVGATLSIAYKDEYEAREVK